MAYHRKEKKECHCLINDEKANQILNLWKCSFPDAVLLLSPSQNNGVGVITHTMGDGRLMRINGLISRSPLANNALYSFECAREVGDGEKTHYLNLYEIMIPDIPGTDSDSTAEYYTRKLWSRDSRGRKGIRVAGVHFHWWGSSVFANDKGVSAIHHQGIDVDPFEFSEKTIKSLQEVMCLLDKRGIDY